MPLVLQPDALNFANSPHDRSRPKLYKFRLEPLAQACLKLYPGFSLQGIDILCGLNNLRKIFEFAIGKQSKSFRIDMELFSTTLMMTRWEPLQDNMSETSLCRGYGRGFEASCTTQEGRLSKSSSHHRVISYSLGDLNLIVQFEADALGCHCSQELELQSPHSDMPATNQGPYSTVSGAFQNDIQEESAQPLDIVDVGTTHSLDCIIEIKSRDHKNKFLDDIMIQMWLSGCRRLYLGRHIRGRFETDAVFEGNVENDLRLWQIQHEAEIACFVTLLEQIRQQVSQSSLGAVDGRFALVCERVGTEMVLKLWRRESGQDLLRQETINILRHCQVAR
jgi:hypothetical protein